MEQSEITKKEEQAQHLLDKVMLNSKYSEDVKALVRSDVEYGLSKEQIEEYYRQDWDIERMKIYSRCLRNGYEKDVIGILTQDGFDWRIMKVALEFYERRVPIDVVEQFMYDMESPVEMKKALEAYLKNLEAAKESIPVSPEYVKKCFEQIEESIKGLSIAQDRYDALSEKLDELKTEKMDKEVEQRLVDENKLLTEQAIKQQETINLGEQKIAELRNSLEGKDKEVKKLEKTVTELKQTIGEKDSEISELKAELENQTRVIEDNKEEKELHTTKAAPEVPKESVMESTDKQQVTAVPYIPQVSNVIPVYVQVPVTEQGKVVDKVVIDRMERKSVSGVAAILGKLGFKKKSRQDIVRLVANGDLNPEQLEQIKIGMEKGLTESQLEQLINNNLSPERMEKVIAIAELDNRMND